MREECRVPEAVLRRRLAEGARYSDLAREHGCEPHAIRSRCRRLGLPRSAQPRGEAPSEAVLRIALGIHDVSLARIAASLGCSEGALRVAAKRYGLPTAPAAREAFRDARR